ncbi:AraC family transcriptional regulator [Pareuzebyella sediminis]|uniref:AraC family transcriptional regulator n=1 Tax=Pareuzebyella sediminis TaxID=2607998 RepID=UPI0011F03CF2|nr:AraC family transcriptional regulator [Pareuzebyella sediminis]
MKVYPFKIAKPLHQNLIVQEDHLPNFYGQLHQHKEVQLSLVVKGRGKLIVGDSVHRFSSGDFFVIASHSPHLFTNEYDHTGIQMVSLFFTESTFGEAFFELQELQELRLFFTLAQSGFQLCSDHSLISKLVFDILESDGVSRFIGFLNLLKELCAVDQRPLTKFVYPKEIGSSKGSRMQKIIEYTVRNFQNEIDLVSASEIVHMTPNAFCRFFKQHTNKTFFQFLIELRIEHACQLLQKNRHGLSILEISEQSGFKSISNFNRQFKKHKGCVPSQYISESRPDGT